VVNDLPYFLRHGYIDFGGSVLICGIVRYLIVFVVIVAGSMLRQGVKDTVHAASIAVSGPYVSVDLTGHAKSLNEILGQLTKQTGYKIEIPKDWDSLQVKGKFIDVPVEKFFRRIIRGQSISVMIDKKRKNIQVRSYQEGTLIGFVGKKIDLQDALNSTGCMIDPETGICKDQLADMQAKQIAQMERYKNNPNSIDPDTGIRYYDLRKLQEEQLRNLAAREKDPNAIDYETGLFNGDLRILQDEQILALEKNQNNPVAIDPQTGMAMSVLKRLQKQQICDLKKMKKEPTYIDPESGMFVRELEKIRKQQLQK